MERVFNIACWDLLGASNLLNQSIHELAWIVQSWKPQCRYLCIAVQQILPKLDPFCHLKQEVSKHWAWSL